MIYHKEIYIATQSPYKYSANNEAWRLVRVGYVRLWSDGWPIINTAHSMKGHSDCEPKIRMAQWQYDDDDGVWATDDGWRYDPNADVFKHNDAPVPLDQVPLNLRQSLEDQARDDTNVILDVGQQQAMGQPVVINNRFVQDEITPRVVLGNATFGSDGASPCLIVFATGTDAQGQQVAVGAHLSDQVYAAPGETVDTMLGNLGEVVGDVSFDIFGGEVGEHTVINPPEDITMDYSRYYPFFQEIESRAGVTIRRYNFPSNGPNQRTGAAINRDGVVAVFHH